MKRIREVLAVTLFFAFLTIIFFFPVVLNLNRVLVNFPNEICSTDYGEAIWNFWWTKKALTDPNAHFYFTNWIFYPARSTSLVFCTISFYNSFLAVFLSYFLNLVKTYNLLYLSTFVFTGVFTYYLVKYLTRDKAAGLLAGVIFSFCVFHIYRYWHIHYFTYYWIPVYVLALYKLKDEGKLRHTLLMAFSLVLACSVHWDEMVYLFLFSALFVFYYHKETFTKSFMARLVLGCFFFLVIISPEAYPLVRAAVSGADSYAVEPVFAFREQLLGRLVNGNIYVWPTYYGYVATFLALVALVFFRKKDASRDIMFWGMVTGFFFLMTLGPRLIINNNPTIPLPYGLFQHLPIFSGVRVPERYIVMVQLGIACLASLAVSGIAKKKGFHFAGYVAIALVLLEMSPHIQTRWTEIKIPRFYEKMAIDKGDYAIVEFPLMDYDGIKLFFQTVHNKKLVNGYVSHVQSVPKEFLAFVGSHPLLDAMSRPFSDCRLTEDQIKTDAHMLGDKFGIKYLIFNKKLLYPLANSANCDPGTAPLAFRFFPWDVKDMIYAILWDSSRHRHMEKKSGLPALMRKSIGKPYYEDDDMEVYKLASY